MPDQNKFRHPTTLQDIIIDSKNASAYYYDPAIWVLHSNLKSQSTVSEYITIGCLKSYLLSHLPAYMCPQAIEVMDKIPLTESKKINRDALLRNTHLRLEKPPMQAKNLRQKEIINYWEKLLNVKNIGINYDFFQLGGQSLNAIQMLSFIRDKYHVNVSLQVFYIESTIRSLDQYIESQQKPRPN